MDTPDPEAVALAMWARIKLRAFLVRVLENMAADLLAEARRM